MTPRALRSAPREASSLTISAWLCAAAHIKADWPPHFSLALTSARASSSNRAAATLPLRATAISGVSPSGFVVFGSAPALSSASMTGAEPMMAASASADVPNWFFRVTFARALISARTSSRSSLAAAHITAVVPSGPGAFGSAPVARRRNAAARSPRSVASSNRFSAAVAIVAVRLDTATTAVKTYQGRLGPHVPAPASATDSARPRDERRVRQARTSDLREDAAAVANLLHRDVVAVEQRHEQIREARVLRILQVLAALDASVRVAEDGRRQRIVVVPVAVAHVAAEDDRRVVEHGAAALLRLRQPLDELREHLG